MLDRIRLLHNIGQFESVSTCANIALLRLILIYAENGRGKTTLSAILRSLGTGDPILIAERHRLGASNPPYVVVQPVSGNTIIFDNGAWTQTLPSVAVFDDVFVDENVYSGLSVDAEHRQNLHELILGSQGVVLSKAFQALVGKIEEHNRTLRQKADAMPASVRSGLSIEEFCALQPRPAIDEEIQAAKRTLAAARDQDTIRNAAAFGRLGLPNFDLAAIEGLLARSLGSLDMTAVARVQAHLAGIGLGGERWIADGMRRVQSSALPACPFCAQDLSGSPLVAHYRAYFSAAYEDLKRSIVKAIDDLDSAHGGAVPAAFERGVRVCAERRQFWSKFCDLPDVSLDTAAIARAWHAARDAVRGLLTAKQAAPLEAMELSAETRAAVDTFNGFREQVDHLNENLQAANDTIRLVKEQAASGNPAALAADIARLNAVKARFSPEVMPLCNAYLAEKKAKVETEDKRAKARDALDTYRTGIFPSYETAINLYLGKFGAGFRLANVVSSTTRGGLACTYSVAIGNASIPIGGTVAPGSPSFRSTLSSGDRNALALAFFFAVLDRDPTPRNKVIVIDDPITSLDEHRKLTTVQEIRRLAERVGQLIVLSHSKAFLCEIWKGSDKTCRLALEIGREGDGSTLREWDVHNDLVTEHDRRHALLRSYLESSTSDNRKVAEALRPVLEKFVRVAYPDHFAPGDLLGPFVNLCRQRIGKRDQILDALRTQDLEDILIYANKFHHDTNRAYETEAVNDGELVGFVRRTLAFTRH
ncbi:MAG: AAA family ATPase [Stellaceae bacterium]